MGWQSCIIPGETSFMGFRLSMPLKRSLYLDQIKALVVALVIAVHVPGAFGDFGWIGVRIPVEDAAGPVFWGFFRWYIYAINSLCQ